MTRCNKPATAGHPKPERCKEHHGQYRLLYKKYKEAQKEVDRVRNGREIPTEAEISEYTSRAETMQKLKWVSRYVKAIRVERTGRDIHSKRFFLKVDDGHKIRIKVLAKEMEKANRVIEKLGQRVLELYIVEHPEAEWAKTAESEGIWKSALRQNQPSTTTQGATSASARRENTTSVSATVEAGDVVLPEGEDAEGEDEDLVELAYQAEKRRLCAAFEAFMDLDHGKKFARKMFTSRGLDPSKHGSPLAMYMAALQYYHMCQYARRVVFHHPVLFAKSLDKVTFRDMILSDDFDLEDATHFAQLFVRVDEFPLPWMKDAMFEALEMMKHPNPESGAANLGDVGSRVKVLGGWIYNRKHTKAVTDEVWWHLFKSIDPQSNTENRYVRLCSTYDDLIRMLSVGGLGLLPPPGFCRFENDLNSTNRATAARMHLSISGVVIADMVSPQRLMGIEGPIPTNKRPQSAGKIVWAEVESRAYLFGAVRHEKGGFSEAFLEELRARPDLYQLLVWSETDPQSLVEESGADGGKALPPLRSRTFEASRSALQTTPRGEWEIFRSAKDILFSTEKDKMIGYIASLRRPGSAGWFFHFKEFPVRYIVVLDAEPRRHGSILMRLVAWAALRAGGYAKGEYSDKKYEKASDSLFEEKAKERLSWMKPELYGTWSTTKMADAD
ncbi:hypothetical protein D9611_012915 [Ephemerocybe angulata]|uniref:Uncharacterized protein n=1 Tax=Ephemerocybe angulata TaxID=980116 RepID=A0A8H5FFG1_9AGAR|nr:hypothetical protein D9611_012915 [Tulosesus angulatus]